MLKIIVEDLIYRNSFTLSCTGQKLLYSLHIYIFSFKNKTAPITTCYCNWGLYNVYVIFC